MNGKKAKQLRRHAEKLTEGAPMADYAWLSLNPLIPRKKTMFLRAYCTRYVYKQLKKAAK